MTAAADGTAYDLAGPDGAPAVALVHGLGLCRGVWQWMLPDLQDRYRVVTYDLPGHGESRPCLDAQGGMSLAGLSAQLAGLLDHLQIERAAVVGFSVGGIVARRFAQDHPQRTAALGVLHSAHRRTAADQEAVRARARVASVHGAEAGVDAALARWFTEPFRAANPEMMDLVRGWMMACDPDSYTALYRVLAESVEEVVAPDPPVACPALVLTADDDRGNGPDMAAAIAGDIDGAEIGILPGLRHMALAERPQAVNVPLRAFLDRHWGKTA